MGVSVSLSSRFWEHSMQLKLCQIGIADLAFSPKPKAIPKLWVIFVNKTLCRPWYPIGIIIDNSSLFSKNVHQSINWRRWINPLELYFRWDLFLPQDWFNAWQSSARPLILFKTKTKTCLDLKILSKPRQISCFDRPSLDFGPEQISWARPSNLNGAKTSLNLKILSGPVLKHLYVKGEVLH